MGPKRNQRAASKRNAKKPSAESQIAETNSVVFLVPVNSVNAMNSTVVKTSNDGASTIAPKILSSSCPELINGKKVYIIPNNGSFSANSLNTVASNEAAKPSVFVFNKGQLANSSPNIVVSNPVLKSPVFILNKGQIINTSPIAGASPTVNTGSMLSPNITGAALQTKVLKGGHVANSVPIVTTSAHATTSPTANNGISQIKYTHTALPTSFLRESLVANSSPVNSTPAVLTPKPKVEVYDENPFMDVVNSSVEVTTTPINESPCETKENGFSFDLDLSNENSYSNLNINFTASPITATKAGISPKVLGSVFTKSPSSNSSPIAASSPTSAVHGVLSPKVNGSDLESNKGAVPKNIKKKPQCKRPADKAIATYVFFDLETTGLGHEIGKPNVQITEISMVAMKRKDFENSSSTELKDIRVIQKISLCTRPRSSVSWGAARVTGLNDSNLKDQEPFDHNAANAITAFLTHLPKPVCLLAHNGASYDYPLFKAELNRLSINLSSDILIADTLKAFRELGVPVFPPERKVPKTVKYGTRGISMALDNLHLYFFGKKPVGGHSSEGDCIALAKVCQSMKELMLPWIDENCTTMDTVVPMW